MTKKKTNVLLASVLIILLAVLGILRMNNPRNLNYYPLDESFYLNKLDYFSSYAISTFKNDDYQDIITEVKEIAINKDSIVVCYLNQGEVQYVILKNDSILYNSFNNSNQLSISNLNFMKPWNIVERETLNSNYRLLNQIVIICIIITGFYLTMRVFNIKRLTKGQILD